MEIQNSESNTEPPLGRLKRRLSSDFYFECENSNNNDLLANNNRPRTRSRSFDRQVYITPSEEKATDVKRFSVPTSQPSKMAKKTDRAHATKSKKLAKRQSNKDSDQDASPNQSIELSTSGSSRPSPPRSSFGVNQASEYASVKMRDAKRSVASFFNPTHLQRKEAFLKLFWNKVPANDEFITDYSCAYQREILVHGRMYVTRRHICFHANIFKWETLLVLPLELVSAITKERTAMVIPNAIQVNFQRGTKHFFTSFGRRDRTYSFLHKLWRANIEQTLPSELEEIVAWADGEEAAAKMQREKNWRLSNSSSTTSDSNDKKMEVLSTPYLHAVRTAPNVQLDDANDDDVTPKGTLERECLPPTSVDIPTNAHLMAPIDKVASTSVPRDMNELERKYLERDEVGAMQRDSEVSNESCGCVQHEGTQLLSKTLNISVEQLFLLIFTDTKFARDFLTSQNCTDLVLTDWTSSTSDEGIRSRQIRYTKNLTGMVGPKCAYVTENQTIHVDGGDGRVYVVECEATNGGVPYSDNFVVRTRFCICRRSENQCHVTVHGACVFVKSTWAITRNFIEKPVMQGLSEYYRDLNKFFEGEQAKLLSSTLSTSPQVSSPHKRRKSMRLSLEPSDESETELRTQTSRPRRRSTLHSTVNGVESSNALLPPQYEWLAKVLLIFMCLMLLLNAMLLVQLYSPSSNTFDCSSASMHTLANVLAHSNDGELSASARIWLQTYTQQRAHLVLQSLSKLESEIGQLKAQLALIQHGTNDVYKQDL